MQVRSLLRRLNQEFWSVDTAARVLRIPAERARRLVYALRRVGYVEVVPGQPAWHLANTMAGNALANASAAVPISRAEADRVLSTFLIRVGIVNDAKSSLYSVGRVVVFGSYLGNQDRVGDIDLAIRLDRRARVRPPLAGGVISEGRGRGESRPPFSGISGAAGLAGNRGQALSERRRSIIEFARLDKGRALAATCST